MKLLWALHLVESFLQFQGVVVEKEYNGRLADHIKLLYLNRNVLAADLVRLRQAFRAVIEIACLRGWMRMALKHDIMDHRCCNFVHLLALLKVSLNCHVNQFVNRSTVFACLYLLFELMRVLNFLLKGIQGNLSKLLVHLWDVECDAVLSFWRFLLVWKIFHFFHHALCCFGAENYVTGLLIQYHDFFLQLFKLLDNLLVALAVQVSLSEIRRDLTGELVGKSHEK